MPTDLSASPVERGTFRITFGPFTDETGAAVSLKTATWTLTDALGTVINSRTAVAATPGATVAVLLSGADLALTDGADTRRAVLLEGTYDSSAGADLPYKDQAWFRITPLVGVA